MNTVTTITNTVTTVIVGEGLHIAGCTPGSNYEHCSMSQWFAAWLGLGGGCCFWSSI